MPVYNIPLSTARTTFQNIDVADAKMWVLRADSPFEIALAGGEVLPWPAGLVGEIDHCCIPQGTIGIRNPAGTGFLVLFSSSEFCLDLEASAGAALTALLSAGLLTEGVLSHSFWTPNVAQPQELVSVAGNTWTAVVSAGGLAGQNFSTALPYYGGLVTPQLANAAALGGGSVVNLVRPLNIDIVLNLLSTTALTFTPSPTVLANVGMWAIRTDWFLETPVIGVPALDMVAAVGLGFEPATTTAANGLGGCRGAAIVWSNDRGNDNFWLVACDGANVVQAIDTGISALGHHHVEFQYGVLAGQAQINAVIDGVQRAQLTSIGMTMVTISVMAASVWYPRVAAFKCQAAQGGNNVVLRHAGYDGYMLARIA